MSEWNSSINPETDLSFNNVGKYYDKEETPVKEHQVLDDTYL